MNPPQVTRRRLFAIGVLDIVAPLGFIALELKRHCLSGALFDPLPTPWHLVALLLAPAANGTALLSKLSGATWTKRLGRLLHGAALTTQAFYVLAMGLFVQCFALVFAPLVIGQWALDGFRWPSSGPESLSAESSGCMLMIILPSLTMLGCLLSRPLLALHSAHYFRKFSWVVSGGALAFVLLLLAETPMIRTFYALPEDLRRDATEPSQTLLSQNSCSTIARLSIAPQQFSSDGLFDCEGPVDVFGPSVHILNGWASSTEMWRRLRAHDHASWLALLNKLKKANPSLDSRPTSWRGLSPCEIQAIESNERRARPKRSKP